MDELPWQFYSSFGELLIEGKIGFSAKTAFGAQWNQKPHPNRSTKNEAAFPHHGEGNPSRSRVLDSGTYLSPRLLDDHAGGVQFSFINTKATAV